MRTLPSFLRPLRSTLFALATLGAASSLLACSGDDTNPPAPATDSGAGDASKPAEGGSGTDAGGTDSAPGTDSATGTDSGATDSGQPG